MTRTINFGAVDDTWRQYGLEQAYITVDGRDVSYKVIFRNNELIKVLGSDYYLFPNEEALKMAGAAAGLAGLEVFTTEVPGVKNKGNVLFSENEARMRALYILGKTQRVDGDEVSVGVNVFNAIDGSSSFGCSLFTFRHICSNGVIFGKETLMSVRRIHSKGMEEAIEALKSKMILVMEEAASVLERYREMAQVRVTDKLVDQILRSRLPARILPDYVTEEEATIPDITEWDLYNDLTQAIWHNEKSGLHTKAFQFNTLHSILPLQVRQT